MWIAKRTIRTSLGEFAAGEEIPEDVVDGFSKSVRRALVSSGKIYQAAEKPKQVKVVEESKSSSTPPKSQVEGEGEGEGEPFEKPTPQPDSKDEASNQKDEDEDEAFEKPTPQPDPKDEASNQPAAGTKTTEKPTPQPVKPEPDSKPAGAAAKVETVKADAKDVVNVDPKAADKK